MANRVDGSAASPKDELFSIGHNPLPDVTTMTRRGSFDAGRVIPFHVDPNWFDTIWYGEPRAGRGISVAVVRLLDALRAARARPSARPIAVTAWQGQGR